MAASASGHTATEVARDMPMAIALQYQAMWLEMEGNTTSTFDTPPESEHVL